MAQLYKIQPDPEDTGLDGLLRQLGVAWDDADTLTTVRVSSIEVVPARGEWRIVLQAQAGSELPPRDVLQRLESVLTARLPVESIRFVTAAEDDYMLRIMEQAKTLAEAPPQNGQAKVGASGAGDQPILGRSIQEKPMPLEKIMDEERSAVVCGEVFDVDVKELRSRRTIITFAVTDQSDSLAAKIFVDESSTDQLVGAIKDGRWLKLRGPIQFDRYTQELTMIPRDIVPAEPKRRLDDADVTRVELHLHTKMSALDGACDISKVVGQVAQWGHPAVAITDHGVVQAFPEAYAAARKFGIKVIYGVEGYLVENASKQSRPYHIILLAQNYTGLRNLYRLISFSHMNYFYRRPRIPRAVLDEHREGLIVGSACEAGELFQAVLHDEPEEKLVERAKYYDYLEIQPIANNQFMLREGVVADDEGLRNLNRRIVALGETVGRPVVATGDVHFQEPEDNIYRQIIMAAHGFTDVERPTPLYLRTTGDMLAEFAYLGEEKAREVVISVPRSIAERCEEMRPVPEGLHAPHLEGAEESIRSMAMNEARRRYGDPLPDLVAKRLDKELRSIIDNGFASLYLIAHKLVNKSLEDGYLVGSRGSVGSSFVATMCRITEVNPLPPHYLCLHCHFSEFFDDGSVGTGIDLPSRLCPECGREMERDGFDIPFEVFLGFHGDKVPDIDLNFSGEYQSQIHRYTEELFGKERVFRAGTIATLAERTAFGYVKKFMEERGSAAKAAEVNRLVRGCTGVRRTTGQHPGGVMVVPEGKEIFEFSPIQYPANDRSSGTVTTHFDFHSLHDQLVKLDCLGHDDPTVLRMLEDITGVDVSGIPLDDPETMAIFSGLDSLGLTPDEVGSPVGTLGIPEFGTRFVRRMLEETLPRTMGELVRISGLSHGTNVWTSNAQEIIKEGIADLKQVIATRDDIMSYLIRKGLEPGLAFTIMESVRKGKGLKPEMEAEMKAHDVPAWYVESCKKISYMFPRAHAAAYVTMAFRIAYFKVHHPEAFYATYFTVRADEFDADLVVQGPKACRKAIDAIEKKGNDATAKEKSVVTVLEVVLEAMARGTRFLPVDVYESDSERFLLRPQGLLCPLVALQGVGGQAAMAIAQGRTERDFTSVEDLRKRTRVSKTVIEVLSNHGSLGTLPETDQVSLF